MDLYKAKYSDKKSGNSKSNKGEYGGYSKGNRPSRSFRNSHQSDSGFARSQEMYDATCGDCGVKCKIPFEPKFSKPVYCSKCYEKNEPRKSRVPKISRDDRPRNDRYSRDDRPRNDRYSRDDRNQKSFDDDHSKRSRKFQKKRDNFYSDGSEKFYTSIKEKLFEILGGKICSSCGFRDARALGFAHISDSDVFDRIRRGGFASSWGKYISEPELAKKELRVLCMNCNEIREPQQKIESEKPKKKSRYFPR